MNIKRITLDEYEEVVALFDAYRVFYEQESNMEIAKRFIRTRLSRHESVIFASYSDTGEPIGFTQLYPIYSSVRAAKMWILNDLFVDPQHRQKGVARKLMEKGIQFAIKDDATSISLETAKDNLPAKALYEKMGFMLQDSLRSFDVYELALDGVHPK